MSKKKWHTFKNWSLVKNIKSFSSPYETWWNFSFHVAIIFTKFHEDWRKIVDFLSMANFWTCGIFFYSDLISAFSLTSLISPIHSSLCLVAAWKTLCQENMPDLFKHDSISRSIYDSLMPCLLLRAYYYQQCWSINTCRCRAQPTLLYSLAPNTVCQSPFSIEKPPMLFLFMLWKLLKWQS